MNLQYNDLETYYQHRLAALLEFGELKNNSNKFDQDAQYVLLSVLMENRKSCNRNIISIR